MQDGMPAEDRTESGGTAAGGGYLNSSGDALDADARKRWLERLEAITAMARNRHRALCPWLYDESTAGGVTEQATPGNEPKQENRKA